MSDQNVTSPHAVVRCSGIAADAVKRIDTTQMAKNVMFFTIFADLMSEQRTLTRTCDFCRSASLSQNCTGFNDRNDLHICLVCLSFGNRITVFIGRL